MESVGAVNRDRERQREARWTTLEPHALALTLTLSHTTLNVHRYQDNAYRQRSDNEVEQNQPIRPKDKGLVSTPPN